MPGTGYPGLLYPGQYYPGGTIPPDFLLPPALITMADYVMPINAVRFIGPTNHVGQAIAMNHVEVHA